MTGCSISNTVVLLPRITVTVGVCPDFSNAIPPLNITYGSLRHKIHRSHIYRSSHVTLTICDILVSQQLELFIPESRAGVGVARINKVALPRDRLVLGLVTIHGYTSLICNQPPRPTQPGHPSAGRCNEYRRWSWPLLGKKWQVCIIVGPVKGTRC